MEVYKRTVFSMIKGIIISPLSGILVFLLAQILPIPVPLCALAGIVVAALLLYMAVFSENIYFELEDDGTFRYFNKGTLKNTFELSKCSIGYHRKTEWGIFGSNNIDLKILDAEGKETGIEAGPLGTGQFEDMFEEMEKYAIKDVEVLEAAKK
jgi:hypothetical protein